MTKRYAGAVRMRLAAGLVVGWIMVGSVVGCATTTRTTTTTRNRTTVARVEPSHGKKPKQDASGKHRHEHCHMKGNGKNLVCHDHPHDDGVHH